MRKFGDLFKTAGREFPVRTTLRLSRDLFMQITSVQCADSYQLEIINGKKRFSLNILLRIDLFS